MLQSDVINGMVKWFLASEVRETDKSSVISKKFLKNSLQTLNTTSNSMRPVLKSQDFRPLHQEPKEATSYKSMEKLNSPRKS